MPFKKVYQILFVTEKLNKLSDVPNLSLLNCIQNVGKIVLQLKRIVGFTIKKILRESNSKIKVPFVTKLVITFPMLIIIANLIYKISDKKIEILILKKAVKRLGD